MRRLLSLAVLLLLALPAAAQRYDVLIRNGRVVDGSGNPWFYADVGIVGDRIVFVGRAGKGATAKRTLDATGLIVAPGFIDMLGQSEVNLLIDKQAVSKLTQGITTEITGEGESVAPLDQAILDEQKEFLEHFHLTVDWRTLDQYFTRLEKQGAGINLGTYVGAATARRMVMGSADRPATPPELERMQAVVAQAMDEGALGVSSALIYAPGNYASTDELIALAKVASAHDGIYASHMRNEGSTEMEALAEAFRIGREANIPVEIFHLKAAGNKNWGKMAQVVAAIQQARAEGIDVTADQYPYTGAATSLGAVIPPRFHAGGKDAFLARLKDPAQRAAIRQEIVDDKTKIENLWQEAGGGDGVLVVGVLAPELKKYEGKTITQIAAEQHKDPLDTVMDFVAADRDNTGCVYFIMKEEDVRLAMQQPFVSVGTDYGEVNPEGPLGESKSHPRAYGSFPRILGKYVREEHVLRLEDAIRKFTSLPAQREKLQQRGLLRPGYFADVTIFNPDTVIDVATYDNPNRPSQGIEFVLVNGVLELEHGRFTGQLGGRPLRGPGYVKKEK
ncbi:MAG TPA: D-aminoacylase [Terriglobales bacterium]|nr:D-aminoacylase [Terriglobales bacterium]